MSPPGINSTEKSPSNTQPTRNDDTSGHTVEAGNPRESQPPPHSVFTTWQKRAIVFGAAMTAFFSPLSGQIYLPALTTIADDLNVSASKVNLTITTYMIIQAIMPMFVGSLADSGGRRPAYIICFVIYIAACISLALAPSYASVLGLRCLQSAGASPSVALCSAVVADVATSAERGTYVGFTVVPAVLAPALGPVIGGLLSQSLGWRSIFWFLAILAGVSLLLVAAFLPETCRLIVYDGSVAPPRVYRTLWQVIKQLRETREREPSQQNASSQIFSGTNGTTEKFKFKPPNVLGSVMMLFEKETGVLLGTTSISYTGFYALATAMPSQYSGRYGLDDIQVGLTYLPLALGSVLAASIAGPLMNRNYQRHCRKLGIEYTRERQLDLSNFPIENARMEIGIPLLGVGGIALVAWGWAVNSNVHLAVPCIMAAILGIGMIGFNNTANVLLVDIHPGKAGTATAANNLTRCLLGAAATALIAPMIDAMGVGWAFTILGACYGVCAPILLLVMVRGIKWRAKLRDKEERKRQRQAEELHGPR